MTIEIVEDTEGFGCVWWFFIILIIMEIIGKNPKILGIIIAVLSFCLFIKNIAQEQPIRCIINLVIFVVTIISISSPIVKSNKMKKIINNYERDFLMSNTEVTQELYESIMGVNPSIHMNNKYPVENISWYDAVYFCNKLSEKKGKTPVYEVNGSTDVKKWNYIPHKGNTLGEVNWNTEANGFRLPTEKEWVYAARCGSLYLYSGSDKIDEVGWYKGSSKKNYVHPVAKKKCNGFGLYDMTGNVHEWCWNSDLSNDKYRYYRGGSYSSGTDSCLLSYRNCCNASDRYKNLGFRIVCSIPK